MLTANVSRPRAFSGRSQSQCRSMRAVCRAAESDSKAVIAQTLAANVVAAALLAALPAAAEMRLPPIDSDPNRCERAYTGNTIGQANAVSDKILDLRKCKYTGKSFVGKNLAGALISEADFSNANMQEVILTKSYAVNVNLSGADLTNAIVDRVDFRNANLSGVKFVNAVITGATFENADLSKTTFEDALIGSEDAKRLCANPTLKGDSRAEVGCRN